MAAVRMHQHELAYEVEFADQNGQTLSRAALTPDEVERTSAAEVRPEQTRTPQPGKRGVGRPIGQRADDGRCALSTSRTVAHDFLQRMLFAN